jgi:hypothetical protein
VISLESPTCTGIEQQDTEETEGKSLFSPFPVNRELPLPTVIAGRKARFPAEELRELAGIGAADVERDAHDAGLRFPDQAFRLSHPQDHVITQGHFTERRARKSDESDI